MKKTMAMGTLLLFVVISGCAGKNSRDANLANLGNGICQEKSSGRMWLIEKSKIFKTLPEAQEYVAHLDQGGHHDWRLPTLAELYDLNYLFDLHLNGDCDLNRSGRYWSGEKDGQGVAGAWEISDQCDPSRQYAPGSTGAIRAVRP